MKRPKAHDALQPEAAAFGRDWSGPDQSVRPRKEKIPNHNGEPSGERPDSFAASDVVGAHHHENQSTLRRPWQRTVAAYEVRDGGIYLRKFNVKLATFVPNSALLRDALARMFDSAHAHVESERAALAAPGEYAAAKLPKLRKPKSKVVTVKGRKYFRSAKEMRE